MLAVLCLSSCAFVPTTHPATVPRLACRRAVLRRALVRAAEGKAERDSKAERESFFADEAERQKKVEADAAKLENAVKGVVNICQAMGESLKEGQLERQEKAKKTAEEAAAQKAAVEAAAAKAVEEGITPRLEPWSSARALTGRGPSPARQRASRRRSSA